MQPMPGSTEAILLTRRAHFFAQPKHMTMGFPTGLAQLTVSLQMVSSYQA